MVIRGISTRMTQSDLLEDCCDPSFSNVYVNGPWEYDYDYEHEHENEVVAPMRMRWLESGVFLLNGVGIAYQVVLMRVFSIGQWHHFAYMVISIAMLGFGASGALLAVLRPRLEPRLPRWIVAASAGFALSLVFCYAVSQRMPFETSKLATQPGHVWWLLALYLVLALPFFLLSSALTLAFFSVPARVDRLYAVNMLGSGAGAAGVLLLLQCFHPQMLPYGLAFLAAMAYLLMAIATRAKVWPHVAVTLVGVGAVAWYGITPIRISEYKGLSYALQLPEATVLDEVYSPASVLTAVAADQLRDTPGQIGNYPMSEFGELPNQVGLFFDAGAMSPVLHDEGYPRRFTYLDYVTSAAAYRVVDAPRTVVLAAGGGTYVWSALWHGAPHVTAVDSDPSVLRLMQGPLRAFSGGLYTRGEVMPVFAEGRGFLETHDERYDLISVPALGSFSASSSGVYALNENYLLTVEAIEVYLTRLTDRGVLAIDSWLQMPPRDGIKLFATAAAACRAMGFEEPERHLAMLRSWNNATLLATRQPLSDSAIGALRTFAAERGFDLCWLPGMRPEEANRYTLLDQPYYYDAAQAILRGDADVYYDACAYYVEPPTDRRPYFSRFFTWNTVPELLKHRTFDWVSRVEWGYVALVATLAQAVLVSLICIVLPLVALAPRTKGQRGKGAVVVTFGGLGLAYIMLEMAYIQQFVRFLTYPVYAVAAVLTAFLVFSGLGGLWLSRVPTDRRDRATAVAMTALALVALAYLLVLPRVLQPMIALPVLAKAVVTVALLAPLAFCMGVPFPAALQRVSAGRPGLLAWAWGINGCLSVVGTSFATLIAIHTGFPTVVLAALTAYAIAYAAFRKL